MDHGSRRAMCRRVAVRAVVLLALGVFAGACRPAPTPRRADIAVTRQAGSWQGRGNGTIGIVSDSGRFRIRWEVRNEHPKGSGTFRLAVHSAVSGRPLQVVADQRGEGSGTTDFADDPRPYNFMVDSSNVDWSITVDEVVSVPSSGAGSGSPRQGH
jgi:hypothetical protein